MVSKTVVLSINLFTFYQEVGCSYRVLQDTGPISVSSDGEIAYLDFISR